MSASQLWSSSIPLVCFTPAWLFSLHFMLPDAVVFCPLDLLWLWPPATMLILSQVSAHNGLH